MAGDERSPTRDEPVLDGAGMRVAVLCARFNDRITERLLDGARRGLVAARVRGDDVTVVWVPGSFELPLAALTYARSGRVDAVIALGCVVRGETSHYDLVAGESARGLLQVQLDTGVPVAYGVLATENVEQALARSEDAGGHNVGEECAAVAVEMVALVRARRGWQLTRFIVKQAGAHVKGGHDGGVLKLVLPKGSLEKATLDLFEAADLTVTRGSSVDYKAVIDDPRIDEVRILRPQEIPRYVAEGVFDLGITGRDWIEETASEVVSLGELHYSKASARPISVVVAVAADSPVQSVDDLPHGLRVSTEYPELTRRFFEKRGIEADIRLSYGATEAKVPDIVDCIVDITETGRALRAAGLKIIDTILVSFTELIANPAAVQDAAKGHAMQQINTLLQGALEARGKVLVKLNVGEADLDAVIALLPSMKAPTVAKLFGDGGYAVETVVPKSQINTLIPALKDHGASDIIELPLAKIVH